MEKKIVPVAGTAEEVRKAVEVPVDRKTWSILKVAVALFGCAMMSCSVALVSLFFYRTCPFPVHTLRHAMYTQMINGIQIDALISFGSTLSFKLVGKHLLRDPKVALTLKTAWQAVIRKALKWIVVLYVGIGMAWGIFSFCWLTNAFHINANVVLLDTVTIIIGLIQPACGGLIFLRAGNKVLKRESVEWRAKSAQNIGVQKHRQKWHSSIPYCFVVATCEGYILYVNATLSYWQTGDPMRKNMFFALTMGVKLVGQFVLRKIGHHYPPAMMIFAFSTLAVFLDTILRIVITSDISTSTENALAFNVLLGVVEILSRNCITYQVHLVLQKQLKGRAQSVQLTQWKEKTLKVHTLEMYSDMNSEYIAIVLSIIMQIHLQGIDNTTILIAFLQVSIEIIADVISLAFAKHYGFPIRNFSMLHWTYSACTTIYVTFANLLWTFQT